MAIRNPSDNRSLIVFTAWSSLAHSLWMGAQGLMHIVMQGELIGSGVLALIGICLLALRPAKLTTHIAGDAALDTA